MVYCKIPFSMIYYTTVTAKINHADQLVAAEMKISSHETGI